jgi:uncharacterized repeat protein (TIGR02543 family)
VAFDSNGGSVVAGTTGVYGGVLGSVPDAPTRTGYVFQGWYYDAGLSYPFVFNSTKLDVAHGVVDGGVGDASLVLYAKWLSRVVSVTFSSNGSTVGSATGVYDGVLGAVPLSLSRAGYSFQGWYYDVWLTGAFAFNVTTLTVEHGVQVDVSTGVASLTLYALWDAVSTTVSYNPNQPLGAVDVVQGTMDSDTAVYGDPFTLQASKFSLIGYRFLGWATSSGGAVVYSDGRAFDAWLSAVNLELYAVWGARSVDVVFDSDGGSVVASTTGSYGGVLATAPKVPVRTGYSFQGWYYDVELSYEFTFNSTKLDVAHGVVDGSGVGAASLTLYADWVADPVVSTSVSYNSNRPVDASGTVQGTMVSGTAVYGGSFTLAENNFVLIGYMFQGWATTANGVVVYGDGVTVDPWPWSVATTLYAKWSARSVDVTFNSNGGSTVPSTTGSYSGVLATAPTPPSKPGYVFQGWYYDTELTKVFSFGVAGTVLDASHGVTNDVNNAAASLILYAGWQDDGSNVVYFPNKPDSASGSVNGEMASSTAVEGQPFTLAENNFTLVGYIFQGWALTSDGAVVYSDSYTFQPFSNADKLELFAKWSPRVVNVTFNSGGGSSVAGTTGTYDGVLANEPIPEAARDGYTFLGWHYNVSLGSDSVFSFGVAGTHLDALHGVVGGTDSEAASLVLYAKWQAPHGVPSAVGGTARIALNASKTFVEESLTTGLIISAVVSTKPAPPGADAASVDVGTGMVTFNAAGLPAGTYSFKVTWTDELDQQTTANYAVTVQAPPSPKGGTASIGLNATATFTEKSLTTGSIKSATVSTKPASPATNAASVTTIGSLVTFNAAGISAGTYSFKVTWTDDLGQTGVGEYQVKVVEPTFLDVPAEHVLFDRVEWLVDAKIICGYVNTPKPLYRPDSDLTRAEMATFLYRMAGSPAFTAPTRSSFVDVSTDVAYYKAAEWVAATGLSQGYQGTDGQEYRPNNSVTRAEMAIFLYRLAGSPAINTRTTSPFVDVTSDAAYYLAVVWLASENVSVGYQGANGSEFKPLSNISRGEMASFAQRILVQGLVASMG